MTTTEVALPQKTLAELSPETLNALIAGGDLSRLSQPQRLEYYKVRCERAGLDPSAQPFEYLTLQGKTILYAKKTCTDQLASIHKIRASITSQVTESDIRVVTARAIAADGRETEDVGAVNVSGLKGEALANALMKAVTKAKRRAILSLCGLGMLDETEVETIPGAVPGQAPAKPAQPTLAAAAERSQAPREVKAEVLPRTQEKPAQAVTEQGTVDPWPLDDKVGEPQLGRKGSGYVYQGCFMEEKIVDGYNRWKLYKVETKNEQVNGKPWSEMPFGSPDGAREGWLRAVSAWCAKLQQEEGKSTQLGERATYCLFLMEQKRYHDKMALLDAQHREDEEPSETSMFRDDEMT